MGQKLVEFGHGKVYCIIFWGLNKPLRLQITKRLTVQLKQISGGNFEDKDAIAGSDFTDTGFNFMVISQKVSCLAKKSWTVETNCYDYKAFAILFELGKNESKLQNKDLRIPQEK